jgi:predicted DNA-binding antitoxin AbrB/MazE fold protein
VASWVETRRPAGRAWLIDSIVCPIILSWILGGKQMPQIVTATFEDGILKPSQPLDLEPHTEVQLTIELLPDKSDRQRSREALAKLMELCRTSPIHPKEAHLTRDQLHERR